MDLLRTVLIARLVLDGVCPWVVLAGTFLCSTGNCLLAGVIWACLTWPVPVGMAWGFDNAIVFPLHYLCQSLLFFSFRYWMSRTLSFHIAGPWHSSAVKGLLGGQLLGKEGIAWQSMCICCMWHPAAELWQARGQSERFVFAIGGVTRKADPACGCLQSARVSLTARVILSSCILSVRVTNSLCAMKTDQALFLL